MKIATIIAALALAIPTPALATETSTQSQQVQNSPTLKSYGGPGGDEQNTVQSAHKNDNRIVHQLPLTGFDVIVLVLVGLGLLLLGLVLARVTAVRQRR